MIRKYLWWGWMAWSVLWMGMGVEQASEAADIGGVRIHGFGGWAYGRTNNANHYLMGNEDGNYDETNFSLNFSSNPSDRLSVYVQTGLTERFRDVEIGIDYAFAEWFVGDALSIRAGKVKAPFLLYTEIYDVGTLRPFFDLPPGIYRQFTAEAYKGIGLTGSLFSSSRWSMRYDLYGGELELLEQLSFSTEPQPSFYTVTPILERMVGGRAFLQTPIDGLEVGVSSYVGTGDMYFEGQKFSVRNFDSDYAFIGASVEYLSERFWFRSEYAGQHASEAYEFDAVYVEPAYKFTDRWQIALRYEWLNGEAAWLNVYFPQSFLDHQDVAVGLNYWFSPAMVAKLAYHAIQDNRCAQPDSVQDFLYAVQRGRFEEQTNLVSFGVQFSF